MTLRKKIALIAAGVAILGAGTLATAPQASADGLTIVLPFGNSDNHDHDRDYHRDFRYDEHRDNDRRFDDHRFGDRHDGYSQDRGDRGFRGHDDNHDYRR